ncbi:MAG TPA: acyltransferase family protein [Rubrobacter sp.]|nr:acyltransferase family protein [Rubrobacter sp.]
MLRQPQITDAAIGGKGQGRRAHATSGDQEVRLPYRPGLDGLRALAVIAVLLYHADLAWIPGGFLGVEVFFVISGYLITALLLAEWRQRGRIDLKTFWMRRARRLLPGLYVLLVATLAFAVVFLPKEVAGLRGDVLAAFGYITNWYLIFGQESYFESVGRPSLLQHLWSLAVEEQFYLLWPPILALGLGLGATRLRRRRVLTIALVGATVSAVAMALLYTPGVDPSRIYYGTDTRATGLLFGAALAFLWSPGERYRPAESRHHRLNLPDRGRFRRRWGWTAPLLLDIVGLVALGGLVWFCLHLGEFQSFLYRGGFALVALTTAAAIMAAVHPHTRIGARLLGSAPLRWVGVRSYSIYLWHWPVFMVTRPELDVPIEGLPLLALRLTATVALAHLSYRYIETPVRRGDLGRAWRTLRSARGPLRWHLRLQWAGVVLPILASCALLGVAVTQAKPPEKPDYLASMKAVHTVEQSPHSSSISEIDSPSSDKPQEDNSKTPEKSARGNGESRDEMKSEKSAESKARGDRPDKESNDAGAAPSVRAEKTAKDDRDGRRAGASEYTGSVSAIGDSVMLGAVGRLQKDMQGLTVVDAEVGLQVYTAIDILEARSVSGQLGQVVIVHLGNNGTFTKKQFDEIMQILSGVDRVVFVNVKVPRAWEEPNNEVIAEGVQRYPNAVLVDWHSASASQPGIFYSDGFHLRPKGQRIYADLISSYLPES